MPRTIPGTEYSISISEENSCQTVDHHFDSQNKFWKLERTEHAGGLDWDVKTGKRNRMCCRFWARATKYNLLIKGEQVLGAKNQEFRFEQAKFARVSQTFERKK